MAHYNIVLLTYLKRSRKHQASLGWWKHLHRNYNQHIPTVFTSTFPSLSKTFAGRSSFNSSSGSWHGSDGKKSVECETQCVAALNTDTIRRIPSLHVISWPRGSLTQVPDRSRKRYTSEKRCVDRPGREQLHTEPRHITTVASTGRRIEEGSSDVGLWWEIETSR